MRMCILIITELEVKHTAAQELRARQYAVSIMQERGITVNPRSIAIKRLMLGWPKEWIYSAIEDCLDNSDMGCRFRVYFDPIPAPAEALEEVDRQLAARIELRGETVPEISDDKAVTEGEDLSGLEPTSYGRSKTTAPGAIYKR